MRSVVPWVVPALILAGWQAAGDLGPLSARVLPTPAAVLPAGVQLAASGELWRHLGASAGRAAAGFLVGGSLGLVLGVLTGVSRAGEALLEGSVQMLRPVPLRPTPPPGGWSGGGCLGTGRSPGRRPGTRRRWQPSRTTRRGATAVLAGLDFAAAPGEFVAVVGRSGTGKSTLLRLLAELDRPDAGEVRLGGEVPRGPWPAARVMVQDGRLVPWLRVGDNVRLGLPPDAADRAAGLLAAVGLADRAGDWPAILSGGQRQRVALARALAASPRLLVLDEPFGGLDALPHAPRPAPDTSSAAGVVPGSGPSWPRPRDSL